MTGLDTLQKRELSCPWGESNTGSPSP